MITPVLLTLFIATYALDVLADALNLSRLGDPLPEEFSGIYDPEKYATSLRYTRERTRFEIFEKTLSTVVFLAFWFLGGFGALDVWARSFGHGPIVTGLIFGGALVAFQWLLGLPLRIYSTFGIESRYGFNRTTPATFVTDQLKGALLACLIGAPIFAGIQAFFERAGDLGWLYAWIAFTAVQLTLSFIAPALLMPLFNKFKPLPEGELKAAIAAYAETRRFKLGGVYVMDGSRRSTKANAFFTGFGRLRRLVLFDTLIERQSVEELVAVFAHEVGHFKEGHILKSLALSIAGSLAVFYVIGAMIGNQAFFEAFRITEPSVYAGLVLVMICFGPIQRVLAFFTKALSRRYEFQADAFAVRTGSKPEVMASALKKLSIDNLAHLTPHPLKVLIDYTHPPVLKRIAALTRR